MAERDHAGVADQNVGRHRQQAPDQDLGDKAAPERGQDQRRREEEGDDNGKAQPEDEAVAPPHLGVATKRPVGRNSRVTISTTNETMTACDGLTHSEA